MQIKSIFKLLSIFFIVLFTTSFLLFFYEYQKNNKIEPFQTFEIEATVTNKQYFEMSWYTTSKSTSSTRSLSKHYLVTLTYDSITQTFDRASLFESVEKGDKIYVKLCQEFDDDGNLIRQYLQL